MSDDEREENELDLTSPEVVTKYKNAAEIVNKALQLVVKECKPKAKIVDICEKGDAFIREQTGNMYKNVKKKIERGVAFPTCLSVNNTVCHFSPLASDTTELEEGDIVKIDMGCHIDGFIAVVAHTHVVQDGPVTGRQADVVAAANTAAEVALRLVRPGKKNKDVTDAMQKVAAAARTKQIQSFENDGKMAGLLAWAADVVGGHGGNNSQEDDFDNIPLIFSPEQRKYVQELDRKASSLTRLIQDLRLRLPPPDISQRLPHLHAHSLASNAALALQLNAHSSTREQAQLREETLQQENTAHEKAISNCESKIHEKVQEADTLRSKLKEMDDIEKNLRAELENAQTSLDASHSRKSADSVIESTMSAEDESNIEASKKSAMLDKLEKKKKELSSIEETVQDLESKWEIIQNKALKQLSPAQREKALDKQLHSLIEQLAAKQAQAEGLVGEIHSKEKELERLNGLWTMLEKSNAEVNAARNRFGRGASDKVSSSDLSADYHHKLPYYTGSRSENQQRLMLLRSAFVLYILALHILVFIKISF